MAFRSSAGPASPARTRRAERVTPRKPFGTFVHDVYRQHPRIVLHRRVRPSFRSRRGTSVVRRRAHPLHPPLSGVRFYRTCFARRPAQSGKRIQVPGPGHRYAVPGDVGQGTVFVAQFQVKPYHRAMKFKDAEQVVSGLPAPHIPASRGRALYEHMRQHRPENVLELGTGRGGSAVFIAAALDENCKGHLTSVDSSRWKWRNPTPQEFLDGSGVGHRVTLDKRFSTYTWFLKTELESCMDEAGTALPKYDFIFLDGAKNWSTDGLTVIIAERLLR